jgi:hypothetical protein
MIFFSSPCQRQCELVVCRPLAFHILIFSSEIPQPNEVKLCSKHLSRMLSTKFLFIWPSGFRGDFLEINQSKTRNACGGHVC